ncbi:hypothetical protein SLEP1_g47548 [Rubroshorea leprosula]|uniref:Disease resistance RPP13-like protein 1 n=1 Tax=Rubroshorea leprosula TaxID=152421 RepID=A0AAV5LQU3_9ROSI|nr:hypothetical protein SLEP1_g47548 [Rubroshorea leprosula]
MEIANLAGGAFLSVMFESLFSKLDSFASEWLNSPKKVCAEMQNWKSLWPQIGALLEDAEEKQVSDRLVKLWLADLKDLFYDMEDILEEVEIAAKRFDLSAEVPASTSKRQKLTLFTFFNTGGRSTVKEDPDMASRVEEITARLRGIEANISKLNPVRLAVRTGDKPHKVTAERLPTTPLLEQHVYGRENDKEAILEILLSDEGRHEPYSVIPIVGMGGIGKTTLARLIYNDDKLKGRFGLQAWVCVSEDFDVYRITRAILEQVTRQKCDLEDPSSLQVRLKEQLSNRRFFLVLDDIWNKKYDLWEELQRPFWSGAFGSKIIITTRDEDIGKMMKGNDKVHSLALLENDACLSLFARHALGPENFDAHPNLKRVGEKIVEKCKRLPLAIKTLGGLLRRKAHPEWKNILNSEIWDLLVGNGSILPALQLSYNHLPSHLKRCFAYCSLFPKNYEFDEGELVKLWTAEGFLQQQPQRKECFRDLLLRAFFQRSSRNESLFVMHDLMVDLAIYVAGETCCTLELDGKISNVGFQKSRHLSLFPCHYEVSKRFEFLKEKKNLRTFLPLENSRFYYLSNTVLGDLMKNLKCLRVLSLENYQITELSDQIGDLKHVRYINLSCTNIESLPDSVGYLPYLQTLLLRYCQRVSKLPTTIGNLLDLQHLDLVGTWSLKEFPSEISNLTSLVTLSKFIVGNARGPRVKDLKNLSCFQGQLSILDLQNVLDANDAKEANLSEIEGLDDLSLEWCSDFHDGRNQSTEMQVLRWLKPHQGIHAIQTMMLDEDNSSSAQAFPSLKSLKLQDCPILEGNFPKCIPSLKKLKIVRCPELIYSPISLPSLKELCVKSCGEASLRSMIDLNSLKTLRISRISKLIWLPKNFVESLVALEDMQIEECDELTCLWEEGVNLVRLEKLRIWRCPALRMFPRNKLPTMLKILDIRECEKLESLPEGILMNNGDVCQVSHLEELRIDRCPCVKSFPAGHLPNSFKRLFVGDCKQLEFIPQRMLQNYRQLEEIYICGHDTTMGYNTPLTLYCVASSRIENLDGLDLLCPFIPNLKSLIIFDCKNLKSLPEKLRDLNSLDKLDITSCPGIESMPDGGLLPNLTYLEISNCPGIKSIPDGGFPPNLRRLFIRTCENLKSLPDKLQDLNSLDELEIRNCSGIESIPDGGLPPNLTSLQICKCPGIESIPDCGFPPNLEKLIIDCKNLKKPMQEWGLSSLSSLQTLEIDWICPPDNVLPTSLTSLVVRNVENMKFIPQGLLQKLNSLRRLTISSCPKLQTLPKEALPDSLQFLWISKCNNFRSLPKEGLPRLLEQLYVDACPLLERQCIEKKGDYWPLIARIPSIDISDY